MLTVAFDFDGCLFPFEEAIAEWWAAEGRTPALPAEADTWQWWRTVGISEEDFHAGLEAFGEAGGFRTRAPYPEALEAVTSIYDAGHDLLGVTSRPATRAVECATFGWIADWYLPLRSVLIGPTAKLEVECDVIVDDNPDELAAVDELGEAVGLLLDRPHNRGCDDWPRVTWGTLPALCDTLAYEVSGIDTSERGGIILDALEAAGLR